jgi:hypothetical protein
VVSITRIMIAFRRRAHPIFGLFLIAILVSVLIPVSEALWAKRLWIYGSVNVGKYTPTPCKLEGCTPGFWKQEHHYSSWPAPYDPAMYFETAFDRVIPNASTLVDALWLKGGGLNALARQSVAALLNAASSEVNFAFTSDEVVHLFQIAFDSEEYEETKDLFEAANETYCPLPVVVSDDSVDASGAASDTLILVEPPDETPTPIVTVTTHPTMETPPSSPVTDVPIPPPTDTPLPPAIDTPATLSTEMDDSIATDSASG